jgi:protein TonB
MNKLMPIAILCIAFTGCRKNVIGQQRTFESPIALELVDSPCVDKEIEFGGEFLAEARFPGGLCAWKQFIRQHLRYPPEALDANIVGIVVVQFAINIKGEVYQVKAVSGPEELKQSAEDLIRKSPKWKPGTVHGWPIECIKKQPISFNVLEK